MLQKVETDAAPKALGPYSQAVKAGDFLFVSGQLPIDPKTGLLVQGDIRDLTRMVIQNIEAILTAANSSLANVVRTDVFLTDLSQFKAMNEEYSKFFGGPVFPARQTVQVAALPLGAVIEISCIARG